MLPLIVTSCATPQPHRALTLRDIDKTGNKPVALSARNAPKKNEEEIRQAYENYVKYTAKDDKSRLAALTRLAEIEFEIGDKLRREQQAEKDAGKSDLQDSLYLARLDKTIELLTTSLNDYPKAKNNDQLLYQLAKAYDQKGDYGSSLSTLKKLAHTYPKSPYYIESQFRIAEAAFSTSDFIAAEDAYTEVSLRRRATFFMKNPCLNAAGRVISSKPTIWR